MQVKAFLLGLVTLALVGCATSPVSLTEARSVPSRQSIDSPVGQVADAKQGGQLVVVRDEGFLGSATNLRLSIDGKAVVDLKTSERYGTFLKEGEYILAVIPVPNLFSNFTAAEAPVTIKKGQTFIFRAGFANGGLILQRSTLSGR